MPEGFYFLMGAQFASGLADNALMILGIYFLQEQGYPGWWAPLLKFSFNLAYVLLACVVGPIADAVSKSALMAWMNVLKLVGVLLLVSGVHPMVAFAMTGLAAAVYAPAKYGLVTESVPSSGLVKANAWLEVSVVMSVLLGIALGGWLTDEPVTGFFQSIGDGLTGPLSERLTDWLRSWWVPTELMGAFSVVMLVYGVSALLNAGVREMGQTGIRRPVTWRCVQWDAFWQSNRRLWADPLGGVSLYVTTLYWGVGAVLQFAVLAWAQGSMAMSLQQGALLQALVALGVVCGAVLAARIYRVFNARRALPWGVLLAVLMPLMAITAHLWLAIPLLIVAGIAGGLLLVPMNALLQHRGFKILTAGRSIAVQGFNENLSVVLMLAAYSALLAGSVSLFWIMALLSTLLLSCILPLCVRWYPGLR
jgi:MFS transporter, LPLT family, lysophospholipid transporter